MPCPSHSPWLEHSNYTWRRVQVMKLLIMLFTPTSHGFYSSFFRPSYYHSPPSYFFTLLYAETVLSSMFLGSSFSYILKATRFATFSRIPF
jgi:hypothetical protein